MNLNDNNQYIILIFKRKYYYSLKRTVSLREVFMNFTKDGSTPKLGTQEVMLFSEEEFKKLPKDLKIDDVRKTASHTFSIRGYKNNQKLSTKPSN